MSTLEQRELAGVSPVIEPALPTESKHDSDEAHKKDHELALNQKAMREYEQEMRLYNQENLAGTFDTKTAVGREINEQLGN
ncbi:hypothetical protein J6T66_00270 [bacterium]|nr:hypothetical protein [bacterium]